MINAQEMTIKRSMPFLLKRLFNFPYRELTHSEMIRNLFQKHKPYLGNKPIFIELGSGLTTESVAIIAAQCDAIFYSCDNNERKVNDIKSKYKSTVDNVIFMVGDSLESLAEISSQHPTIQFVFFDSAPSAMHTFKEFLTIERCLTEGTFILIDNAALPGEKQALLTACRKGKVLVPYLLASPCWQVTGHPHVGDSMVTAVYHSEQHYADVAYERPERVDYWDYGK